MNQFFLFSFSSIFSFMIATTAFGQLPQAKMSSSTQPSSTIKGMEHMEPIKQQPTPPPSQTTLPPPLQTPVSVVQQAHYLHPGILVFLNGGWEGSDHLLNLTNNIGVYVTILKPESEALEVTDLQIQKEVEAIFANANIKPQTLAPQGKPPLPAFQIEIFVYPIERGYAASCQGRLFESVILERFKMDPNMAFQAITWEKQHLIVSPKEQFAEQLVKTVQDIVTTFIERFQAYEKMKKSL
jgi:hypothetical protein